MEEITISIITPTYNHEKFIVKCIESVLAQSYPHWEQIIVDDGSNDHTEELIGQYKDDRIKYIKQKNKGIYKLSETYNKALKSSNGEIIAILEGDDFWPPDKLEKQISCFKDPEVVLSWGKAVFTDVCGEFIGYKPKSLEWLKKISDRNVRKYLLFGNFIPACTVMCRRDALMDINGFKQLEKAPHVDYLTWLELGLKGKFLYLDEILGFWRHHEKQISSNMPLEMIESLEYSINFFKERSKYFEFNVGIVDLVTYNLVQIKYNLIYVIKTARQGRRKENRNLNEKSYSKLNKKLSFITYLFLKLNVTLRTIYAIFRINFRWIIVITKDAL
jgi:glycosyltransferase involved in cell wall biosynthesis